MIQPFKKLPLTFSLSNHLGNRERKILGETSFYPKNFNKILLERNPLRIPKARKILSDTSNFLDEFHQILLIWNDSHNVFSEFDVIYIICGKTKYCYDKPFWNTFLFPKKLMPIIGPCPGCKLFLEMELGFAEYIYYNNMMSPSSNHRPFRYRKVTIRY